ncbi:MAG: helix-turn-helix transcriptional regulator [Dehalococcoidia bacterium]
MEQTAGPRLPLPPSIARARSAFVGRENALERLRAAFVDVCAEGHGRITLIAGEPGIGKTRLAAEFAAAAHGEGATVLCGRCDEQALLPYQPFVELLRYAVAHAAPETLAAQLAYGGPEIARLVPELRERVPGIGEPVTGNPEGDRYRLFDGVCTLLENIARERPLVLVLDDLHWADKPTLLLLRHIVRSPEAVPLFIVGAYRETDLDRQHPLTEVLADLRREAGHERILLRGLDLDEAEALLQAVAPHEPTAGTQAFAAAVHRETEGNPFFLHEVVRHLKETGKVYERDGLWRSDVASIEELGIPEGVREVVGRRLSRLSKACQGVLSRASVQGRDFELAVLERVSDLGSDALLDVLDEAIGAGLVEEESGAAGRYRFSHALVQQALYSELNTTRRVRLHRQVGEALQAMGAGERPERYGELAHHFCEAASSGVAERAVRYSMLAAERAFLTAAYEETAAHGTRALELQEEGVSLPELAQAELHVLLGEAAMWLDDLPGGARHADRAIALLRCGTRPDLFFRAAKNRYWSSMKDYGVRDEENIALLREAAERLGEDHAMLPEAHTRLAQVFTLSNDTVSATLHLDQTIALAAQAADPGTRIWGQIALGDRLTMEGRHDEARQALREAADSAGPGRHPWQTSEALQKELRAVFAVGDLVAFRERLPAYSRAVRESRDTLLGIYSEWVFPATLAWLDGDQARLDTLNAAGKAMAKRINQPLFILGAILQLAWQRCDVGRLDEVWGEAERGARGLGRLPYGAPFWGRLQLIRGDLKGADETFQRFAEAGFPVPSNYASAGYPSLAEFCALLGERDHAAGVYELALPYAHFNADLGFPNFSFGSGARPLGMLAALMERYDDAERHFEDALAMETRMGHRPALAKTKAEYAAMLLERNGAGDRGRARELAALALSEAESMRMRPTVDKAERLLRDLGAAPRPVYPAGLSEREVEVLRLVAEGMTNGEIAAKLVLSPHTVIRHVSNILDKTGCDNRRKARDFAREHGLV